MKLSIERKNKHISNSRCSECKNVIYEMIRKIYGQIKIEHKFIIPTSINEYKNYDCYKYLKNIYDSIISYRKYDDFVKSKFLSPCDIYVVDKDFIIELDEDQHFSKAREISLKHYPTSLKLFFNKEKWIKNCEIIKSKDPQPIFRDEQRTWYDTLRDFLPLIDGKFNPTLRILIRDYEWCSLDINNEKDIKKFKKLILE